MNLSFSGLRKSNELERQEERDSQMRSQYLQLIDLLPLRMNQLEEKIDQVVTNTSI